MIVVKNEDVEKVRNAINLQRLGDENIIKIYEIQETEEISELEANYIKFEIIVEYGDGNIYNIYIYIIHIYIYIGGDLNGLIRKQEESKKQFNESEILNILSDICKGVQAYHYKNIVHKNLKPSNILCVTGHMKICDMGIADISTEHTKKEISTHKSIMEYTAPEVLMGKKFRFKADIWSLGCILYELCALKEPFKPHFVKGMVYDKRPLRQYSSQLISLIEELLEVDPEFRPSINILISIYIYIY